MEHETFWTLLQDPAHWQFELFLIFLIFLFDVLIGLLLWPWFRKFVLHHKKDDEKLEDLERRVSALEKKE